MGLAALLLLSTATVASAGHVRTIALSGQAMPGFGEGVTISRMYFSPAINAQGEVAFDARLLGIDNEGSETDSILATTGGGLHVAAYRDGTSPGIADMSCLPRLDDTGRVLFGGTGQRIRGQRDRNRGTVFSEQRGQLVDLFGTPDSLPGVTGGFPSFELLSMQRDGALTLRSTTRSGKDYWYVADGEIHALASTGDQAPGMPTGTRIARVMETVAISGSTATFMASLVEPDNPRGCGSIWQATPDGLELQFQEGQTLATSGGDVLVNSIRSINATQSGRAMVTAMIDDPNADSEQAIGLLWQRDDGWDVTMIRDEDLPHLPFPVCDWYFGAAGINDAGDVLLWGDSATEDMLTGLWVVPAAGDARLLALPGADVPGIPGASFPHFFVNGNPRLNASGQVAFAAAYVGPDGRGDGIWAKDAQGNLQLIVKKGDTLEVAPGDFRVIGGLEYGECTDRPGFNDRGQVVFTARFDDGTSGVFISDLVAGLPPSQIPEPTAGLLALIAVLACAMLRRRPT